MRIPGKPEFPHRRFVGLLFAVGLIVSLPPTCRTLVSEPLPALLHAFITANKQVLDVAAQQAHAEGNVQVTFEDFHLRADRLDVDFKTEKIEANGNVKVEWKSSLPQRRQQGEGEGNGATLEGERFQYQFGTKAGKLDHASIAFGRILFRGSEVVLQGEALTIVDATMTSCLRQNNPHYRITCQSINMQPDRKLLLKKVTLWFGHRRLFTVPKRTLDLGKKEEQHHDSLAPRILFNKTDGALVQTEFGYPLSQRPLAPSAKFSLGVSANRGFRGFAELGAHSKKLSYGIRFASQDVVSDRLASNILVDKRPEVYLDFAGLPLSKRLTADVFATAGNIKEDAPQHVTSNRTNVTLQLTPRIGSAKHPSPFYGSLLAQESWYDGGMSYRALGASLGLRGKLSEAVEGSIQYSTLKVDGATPFDFDTIEIGREVRVNADVAVSRNWKVPFEFRYDIDKGEFPQKKFGLLRTLDCLEYGLTFDTARKEVHLAIRLVGLRQ